ncbi:hypothetical protein EAF00_004259 [Botryotinia globosa]|nr:hypothetical protein EAF00_004259 [Botryotinia globosa]
MSLGNKDVDTFDVIIVGGGTTGSVLETRFQKLQAPGEEVKRELKIGDFAMEGGYVRKHDESEYEEGIQASYPMTLHPMQKAWTDAIQDLGYSSSKNPVEGDVLGGCSLQENGETVIAHANREVVICAGTFGSPKLLELSGIGQRGRLATAGIECLRELGGVGENLQDHLNFGPSVEVLDNIEAADGSARDPTIMETAKRLYEAKHIVSKGLIAQYDIIKRIIFDPEEASSTVFMTRKQRYTTSTAPAPGNYMTILAMLSHPFSRGSSHITTADPGEYPEIKTNYLKHPLDAEILSRHIIQIGQMLEQPKLSAFLKPGGNTLPSGFPRHAKSVEEVTRFIRQYGATNYHPVGTCAMIDEDLDGLLTRTWLSMERRITVYAVAEKGADILKRDLGV